MIVKEKKKKKKNEQKEKKRKEKKKRACRIVDFAVSTDQRVKLKESDEKGKVWFGFFAFNGISTFVGYLMLKPFS